MKTTHIVVLGGMVLVAVVGLALAADRPAPQSGRKLRSPHDQEAAVPAARHKATAALPVVGYLEGRNRTITIKAGPQGPVYSVKTADGKVLCEDLSREQLSARLPELGEFIKNAVAGPPGGWMDASVGTRAGPGRLDIGSR